MRETWFDSWVGKINYRKESLPTPVFCPGAFPGLYSPWSRKESDLTEWLSLSGVNINVLGISELKWTWADKSNSDDHYIYYYGQESLRRNGVALIINTSGPTMSWQIDGETVETLRNFIFSGSKITTVGDYSHEIKRWLLLGRKVMTNLDSI